MKKKIIVIFGIIILLGIIGNIIDTQDNNNSSSYKVETEQKPEQKSETKKKSHEDLTWFAKFQCEKEIKARIPSAKYIHFRQDNYINGNSYTVYGTVDGQNAFGATIRNNFGCEVVIDQGNDKFWIKDLLIE